MKIFGKELKKKGSLQLSINAIVILILAITILGLGLGFIKKQFGSLGEQFESVSSEIKAELVDKIRQSGDLLVFNKIEFEAQVGKPDKFYIGIKNTAPEPSDFRVAMTCIKALGITETVCDKTLVGGMDGTGTVPMVDPWFQLFGEVNIAGGDVGVYPITLQLPGRVSPDTYLMTLTIYKYDAIEGYKEYTKPKQYYIYVR